MIQIRLREELEKVALRYRRLQLWRSLAVAWLFAALIGLVLWRFGMSPADSRITLPFYCGLGAVMAGFAVWIVGYFAPGHAWVARQIEHAFPELESRLLAAIEQRPDPTSGRLGFLQTSVIREAITHARGRSWPETISSRRMRTAIVIQFVTLSLFVLVMTGAIAAPRPPAPASTLDARGAPSARDAFSVTVEPGNTEIEKGTSLLVLARVQGPMPTSATLVFRSADEDETRLPMSRSLDDPIFGTRIPDVRHDLSYHVELDDQVTPTYQVTVFEYPRLERADAKLVYPSYTGMEDRLVQDVRTLSVVEGTELTLLCYLNKPVTIARFVEANSKASKTGSKSTKTESGKSANADPKSGPVTLTKGPGGRPMYQATIRCETSRRLKLELVDEKGRANLQQSEIAIQVVPDQAPTLKIVFPARDREASPLEELDVKATAWDDFGIKRMGVAYALAGQDDVETVLGESAAGRQRHNLAHSIRLEELQAEPDQLLTYHFWVEDLGPDGNVRRTESDMYFAEVRPFEEIYRQGQTPPRGESGNQQQGGSQGAQAAQKLSELQKEIINATWKLIRREIRTRLTDAFVEDVGEVAQSQASALKQAQAMAENLADSESQIHAMAAQESMQKAFEHLKGAREQPSSAPLRQALPAEQAAYQALLKLRAREHQIVRQQSGAAGASASGRSQQQRQQIEQLDLAKEENRYETQRMARSETENEEEREARQVLNRLRELARRQHDLNERLKELQSALQEAKTPEQREEVKKQLARLQEEQQQVLRDTDELKSRMETPENQERMSAERDQLENTRDDVRRASEALEQEQITQAAASGTRAERDFEELRNEFRKRTSGRFNEDMRQMRDTAREIERRQQELVEQIGPKESSNGSKSLREDNPAEKVLQELNDQKGRLGSLVEKMQQTIQDAEQTEPLLSERLYEAARNAQQQNVERALDAGARSLRQGLIFDAQQQEELAQKGISQLREGIERAAQAVLGDETEALRRAREELRDLSKELGEELARNAPEEARSMNRRNGQQGADGERSGESGEPAPGNEKQRDGTGAPSQSQSGENSLQGGGRQAGAPNENESNGSESDPGPPRPEGVPARGQERQESQGQGQGQQGESPANSQGGGDAPGGDRNSDANNRQVGRPGSGGGGRGLQRLQEDDPNSENRPGRPQTPQRVPGKRNANPGQNQRGTPRLANSNPQGGAPDGGGPHVAAPLSGEDFLNWSDRLRDVEEMVDDPELRAEAARIRDQAKSIRAEFKRHSVPPNWNLVRVKVAEPLAELSNRVQEELLRRNSKQAIVPLDRDPVPPKYSGKTRRYYEQLGSGK